MMNIDKRLKKIAKWRRVSLFFATFFCLGLLLIACKKKNNPIGQSALPAGSIMHSKGIDTFQINTYTVLDKKGSTMDPAYNDLGSYVDPVFGKVDASFYTQLTLSGYAPDFGDLSNITIDSAVMAFEFGGFYGKVEQQKFEVYEITDDLTVDSSYTASSTVAYNPTDLVPSNNNQNLITPNLEDPAVVGGDTLNPELRIPIDTVFARHLLTLAESSPDDETFLSSFKGLYFKVNNNQSVGEGSILYLATTRPASKLTVYYHSATEHNKFDFIVNGDAVDFNHFTSDYTSTNVEQVINDTISGNTAYYAQAFLSRAKVDFPTIDSLPKNVIIHSATLELPIDYYIGSDYYPSKEINVSANLFEGDSVKYFLSTVTYNAYTRSYAIDLRAYIQNILNGKVKNYGIYISPKSYTSSSERLIFNGRNTVYKKQPKLTIVYTVL